MKLSRFFTLNINQFPTLANAYDSRAEALSIKKITLLRKLMMSKVWSSKPANQNAKEMISKIEKELKIRSL